MSPGRIVRAGAVGAVVVASFAACSSGHGSGTGDPMVNGGVGTSSSTVQAPGTTGGTTGGATQGNQQQQPGAPSITTRVTSQTNGSTTTMTP